MFKTLLDTPVYQLNENNELIFIHIQAFRIAPGKKDDETFKK